MVLSTTWFCMGQNRHKVGVKMSFSKALLVFAAAAIASSASFAADNGSPNKKLVQPSFTLKLKNEAFVQGNGDSSALSQYNYTPIDSGTTLKCTKTCTITAEVSQQIQSAGADWAICIEVDGTCVESQYQGVQAGPSSFVVGNIDTAASGLAAGNHTVQTFVYTESASATYQYYSFHYAVHQ